VSVVFPASGWEMMAKVRRRWISVLSDDMEQQGEFTTGILPEQR
jgi:hypothetical protein